MSSFIDGDDVQQKIQLPAATQQTDWSRNPAKNMYVALPEMAAYKRQCKIKNSVKYFSIRIIKYI